MIPRRTFIKNLTAVSLASLIFPYRLLASQSQKEIGIQLYSIHNLVKKDLVGTLKLLKEIGYTTIEAAGYSDGKFYGFTPKEFKNIVLDSGLVPLSSHSSFSLEESEKVIDDTLEAGMTYLVFPYLTAEKRKTIDDYKTLSLEFNIIGELCSNKGLLFGYHNHAFEFDKIGDEIPYNLLLNNTYSQNVFFQLDTYWMVYGGYEPVEYFKKYPGRFKLLHLKDMDKTPEKKTTQLGNGIINFPEILNQSKVSGMEHFFVEQEHFEQDPILCITESVEYLNSIIY